MKGKRMIESETIHVENFNKGFREGYKYAIQVLIERLH